jgi:putative DNA primase/helicase
MFDNRHGRGDFLCRSCGAGSGFDLLMLVHKWTFPEARRRVLETTGLTSGRAAVPLVSPSTVAAQAVAKLPRFVRTLARSACTVAGCHDAVAYLDSRGLWPLPAGCTLRAHPSLDYWHDGQRARYPGIVAEVRDGVGDLATLHLTYLRHGKKLDTPDCRKLLSKLTGREGCAVRLMPLNDVLGVAEGIETALSAAALQGVPVWAALNTSLLAKFEPPAGVTLLRVYADHDDAGLRAAEHVMKRLQGRVRCELRLPVAPHKDWNDQLTSRNRDEGSSHD